MICDELHIERRSAVGKRRPVYEKVMRRLKPNDVFCILDIDRAYRSTIEALVELDRLRASGIHIMIVNLHVDTTTIHGRLLYTITSAYAEFERGFLSQRTKEGLAAARLRGKRLGRPPKLNTTQLKRAAKRIAAHESFARVAKDYGIAPWTLSRALTRRAATN